MSGYFDKTDPTKSLKHLAFAWGIGASITWLTIALFIGGKGITSNWVWAFGVFLTAITGAKIVGFGPSPAPTVGAVPDTVIKTDEVKQ
jgi:hypothetical protein